MQRCFLAFVVTAFAANLSADDSKSQSGGNWPQWRGPHASGVAPLADPPIRWDENTNIKWKAEIPGAGSSTPIVWGNRLFVLTAAPTDRLAERPPQADERSKTEPPKHIYQFVVLCLDRATGKTLWRRVACEETPHEGRHGTNSYASGSPTTDGQRLYASFGSRGVYCYDLDGDLLWKRDLGDMRTRYGWGEGVSPVVHDGRLIVNWDHEDQSFITALDAKTGKTLWRVDRDEPTSWATPLVVEHAGKTQVITSGTNRVRSYDLANGELIWQYGGLTVNAIPSPVVSGDVVFCTSGYRGSIAVAIPLDSSGDIAEKPESVVWRHERGTPYVPSPIVYGNQIYFTRTNTAVLSCLDIATGKPVFETQRIQGLSSLYASPAAAAGRIYFVGRDGTTVVLRHGRRLEVLATNKLDEPVDASPVLVGRQLFLRGARHVYCIEAAAPSDPGE